MPEKSPGQVAYEAAAEFNGDVLPWAQANQAAWQVAAEAVREQALQDVIDALPVGSIHAADAIRKILYNK